MCFTFARAGKCDVPGCPFKHGAQRRSGAEPMTLGHMGGEGEPPLYLEDYASAEWSDEYGCYLCTFGEDQGSIPQESTSNNAHSSSSGSGAQATFGAISFDSPVEEVIESEPLGLFSGDLGNREAAPKKPKPVAGLFGHRDSSFLVSFVCRSPLRVLVE